MNPKEPRHAWALSCKGLEDVCLSPAAVIVPASLALFNQSKKVVLGILKDFWIVLASTQFLSIVRAEGGDLCAVGGMKGIVSGLRADTTANPSSGHCDSLGS